MKLNLQRRAATFKRNKSGVTRIVRDGYSTVNGFSKKNAWWTISAEVRKRSRGLCEDRIHRGSPVKGVEVHHIVPLTKGGTTTMANLIHLCKACHDRRHGHLFMSR